MPTYTVIIHTPQELNHASYIQTGLFELQQKGLIDVKVQLSLKKNKGRVGVDDNGLIAETSHAFPKVSFYTLIDTKTNKKISFTTDLYDHAEYFSTVALKTCDFYFKRNFESRFVNILNQIYKRQVYPLGLTFRVQSTFSNSKKNKFKMGVMLSSILWNIKFDGLFFKRLKNTYSRVSAHIKKSDENRFLGRFETLEKPSARTIMFQTRCFLHEHDEDVKQIHQQRYHIIKVLRKYFPDSFVGGFVPSKIATEKYGDALTNVPTAPEEYLNALKKAKIVIYTRGLANSPAWKMAEYLSQGKVIIAEPLTTVLPEPLIEGKELLYFNNDTELVEKIKMVLEDNTLASNLSKNARAYFEKHVHPVQNTKRILEFMLNKPLEY